MKQYRIVMGNLSKLCLSTCENNSNPGMLWRNLWLAFTANKIINKMDIKYFLNLF